MRMCANCGKNYIDERNFCSDCGGQVLNVKTCASCGKMNLYTNDVCAGCGVMLKEEKICTCGGKNDENAQFCIFCGKPFNAAIPQVQTGSWLKIGGVFAAAFVILFLICLVI